MKILKKLSIICLAMLMLFLLVACDDSKGELTLQADKTTALRGETVTLSVVLKVDGAESTPETVTYEITEGADNATLTDNKLVIKDAAPHDAQIKVKASANDLTSNEITVKVNVPLTALSATSSAQGEIARGSSVILQKTISI